MLKIPLINAQAGAVQDSQLQGINPESAGHVSLEAFCRFGQKRRDAEGFVSSFQDVFFMQQRRVMGDSIRLLKCFGSKWQVVPHTLGINPSKA